MTCFCAAGPVQLSKLYDCMLLLASCRSWRAVCLDVADDRYVSVPAPGLHCFGLVCLGKVTEQVSLPQSFHALSEHPRKST